MLSELAENALYIYVFEDAVPAAVCFTPGEDGTVSAAGTFILNRDFPTGSAREIEAYLTDYGAAATVVAGG